MTATTNATTKNSFEVDIDSCYLIRSEADIDKAPALIINPEASDLRLISAAMRRADGIQKMLDAWSRMEDGNVQVREVTCVLEPIAQEVMLLLDAATDRMFKKAQEAKA